MMNKEDATQTDPVDDAGGMADGEDTDRETDKKDLLVNQDDKKKYRSLRVRTISTITILVAFAAFIYGGQVPCLFMLYLLQVCSVMELFAIARRAQQEDTKLPGFRTQQWYFFVVATFYLYGRFIKNNLLVELSTTRLAAKTFSWVLRRHTMVSYSLYMAGFVTFVLSLKRGMYLYQFGQFAWTHTIIILVIVPSSFLVSNMFEGLIWWILPALLVVANDIFAYLAGFFFGRTPLIKLSPKKTWEGFIGGALSTLVTAYVASNWLASQHWAICPRRDLSLRALRCDPGPTYELRTYTWADVDPYVPDALIEMLQLQMSNLPPGWAAWLRGLQLVAMPIQVHSLAFALFASIIAPFGGFAASGFKRAFKMKDFGTTIPGHGGITDRFDCQVIMAMFVYVYYWTYVAPTDTNVGDVLDAALRLDAAQQLELFAKLANLMAGQGLLPGSVTDMLAPYVGRNLTS